MRLKLTPDAFRIAVQVALVSLLAYLAGSFFTRMIQGLESPIGALWATISGVGVKLPRATRLRDRHYLTVADRLKKKKEGRIGGLEPHRLKIP